MRRRKWAALVLAAFCVLGSTQKAAAAESSAPVPTSAPTETPEAEDKKAQLAIDSEHIYEGMEQSFAQGYVPAVKENVLYLAVPFTVRGSLKEQELTVGLDLGKEKDAPFVRANYQKKVEKKEYAFGEEKVQAWLYQCEIPLREDRINGSWPILIRAKGISSDGSESTLEYRLFVTISDGKELGGNTGGTGDGTDGGDLPGADSGTGGGDSAPGDVPAGPDPGGGISSGAGGSDEVLHMPKLLLESCSLSGQRLTAGSEYELELKLKNRNKQRKACNLKVTLSPGEEALMLEKNSEYFEEVDPGEVITLTTSLSVGAGAEQKTTALELQFEYEDEKGTACTGTEKVLLTVSQPVEVELEEFQLEDTVYSLDTISGQIQVLNTGKAPVYNVQVKLELPGFFPKSDFFAGTLEGGQAGGGTIDIFVGTKNMEKAGQAAEGSDEEKYGRTEGKVILTFEDAYGEVYTREQEIASSIAKPQVMELKVPKEEQQESNQWWIAPGILLILLLLGIIAVLAIKLKKRQG